MSDLATGLGLALAIEGLLYAVAPVLMKRVMTTALGTPEQTLRFAGLVTAAIGVGIVWLVRG